METNFGYQAIWRSESRAVSAFVSNTIAQIIFFINQANTLLPLVWKRKEKGKLTRINFHAWKQPLHSNQLFISSQQGRQKKTILPVSEIHDDANIFSSSLTILLRNMNSLANQAFAQNVKSLASSHQHGKQSFWELDFDVVWTLHFY